MPTPDNIFHIGIIVKNMEDGMADVGQRWGVTFPAPSPFTVHVRLADGSERDISSRFVYSRQGPPFLELIEAVPGTVWEFSEGSQLHHVGVWVDDLEAEIAELTSDGSSVLEMASLTPEGKIFGVCYINNGSHIRLEIVPSAIKPPILAMTQA